MILLRKLPIVTLIVGILCTSSLVFADSKCINQPQQVEWGNGGSTHIILCGYKNGDVNTSFLQLVNIPKKVHNGCVTLQYTPAVNVDPDDTLTVSPNEGVVVAGSRGPTTLDLPDNGTVVTDLPLKTDNIKNNEYGIAISGQSSSVDVDVKVDWNHTNDCDNDTKAQ
jgi:hypothetical protein